MKRLTAIFALLAFAAPAAAQVTLGNSVTAVNDASDNNFILWIRVTTGANAAGYTVNKCTVFYKQTTTGSNSQCALFSGGSATSPVNATLVCKSPNIALPTDQSGLFRTYDGIPTGCGTLTANTDYWIGVNTDLNTNEPALDNSASSYCATAANGFTSDTFGVWTSPVAAFTSQGATVCWSETWTVTAVAAGGAPPPRRIIRMSHRAFGNARFALASYQQPVIARGRPQPVAGSLVGCGASAGGADPMDQSTCGNVTTDGSVLSYEPNYNDAAATVISACGTTISTGGSYKLTANLTCTASSTAISILLGSVSGVYLNLNGFTVTGRIVANDQFPQPLHIFGGSVTCNGAGVPCLDMQRTNGLAPPTDGFVAHHLVIQNTNDNGDTAGYTTNFSAAMAGGADSCVYHHVEIIVSGGTAGDPNRSGGLGCTGQHQTALMHNNKAANSAGTNHGASEGFVCYNADTCVIRNNECLWNNMTLANGTVGRCVLLDGDSFGNGPVQPGYTESANVHNNYFSVNDTRALRHRSARGVLFHDNLIDQITDAPVGPSYLGAIHAGDPTSAEGATSTYDYLSSLYSNNRFVFIAPTQTGAIAARVQNAIGLALKDNTVTCSGTGCSADGQSGSFIQASIQTKTGTMYFDLTACRNTVTGLTSPLHADGSGQTQTSTIHHLNSGACTAINAATCDALVSCP